MKPAITIAFETRIKVLTEENRKLRQRFSGDQRLLKQLVVENRRLKLMNRQAVNEREWADYQTRLNQHRHQPSGMELEL